MLQKRIIQPSISPCLWTPNTIMTIAGAMVDVALLTSNVGQSLGFSVDEKLHCLHACSVPAVSKLYSASGRDISI
jgi:hypothetical protein